MNARSVRNKALEIKEMVVDIFAIETWVRRRGDNTEELFPTGYQLVHNPRDDGLGGGVGVLFNAGI